MVALWWFYGMLFFFLWGFDRVYHIFLKFKLDSRHYHCLMGFNEVLTNHIWRFNQIWDTHWDRLGCYGRLSATWYVKLHGIWGILGSGHPTLDIQHETLGLNHVLPSSPDVILWEKIPWYLYNVKQS